MPQTAAMKRAKAKRDKRRRDLLLPKGAVAANLPAASQLAGRVLTLQALQQMLDGGRRKRGAPVVAASDLRLRPRTEVDYRSQLESSGGSGVRRSPDHTYPQKAGALVNAPRPLLDLPVARTDFAGDTTQKMIADAAARPAAVRTPYDEVMIADPAASLQEKGIDRTHRMANSSMLAIAKNVFVRLHEARHTAGAAQPSASFKSATIDFFAAVSGDRGVARAAYAALEAAAETEVASKPAQRPATAAVQAVANHLANSPHNLRFGRAEANRIILHGFDPNLYADGSMTPRSGAIHATGMALIPELDLGVMDSALARTTHTASGAAVSSSA